MDREEWLRYNEALSQALKYDNTNYPASLIINWRADEYFHSGKKLDEVIFKLVALEKRRLPKKQKWSTNLNAVTQLIGKVYADARWMLLYDSKSKSYGAWMQHWSDRWSYSIAHCECPAHAIAVLLLIAQTCDVYGLPNGIWLSEKAQ